MTDHPPEPAHDDPELRALLEEGVVLTPEVAHEALDAMQALRIPALRFSIWLKLPDGQVVPSQVHEGASGAASAGLDATYAWTHLLIENMRLAHEREPEVPGSMFLVYLTTHGVAAPGHPPA